MNKINVNSLLQYIDDYVLIKKSEEFPVYTPGSDLDLIVFDKEDALKKSYLYYDDNIGEKGEMKVTNTENYCHVDFFFEGKLDLRIDFIDNFNFFEKIAVKPSFMVKIFKDRQSVAFDDGIVYVPCIEDDLTLRYFEFLEWFDRRPDKIKHLDYIYEVENEDIKKRFFDNTHRFIQFKRKTWPPKNSPTQLRIGALRQIKSIVRYLISHTKLK